MQRSYTNRARASLPGWVVTNLLLPWIYPKRTGPDAFREKIAANRIAGPALPSKRIQASYDFTQAAAGETKLFRLNSRRLNGSSLKILYVHGGGYVFDFLPIQWTIARRLVDHTGAEVIMPLYPLAPEHTVEAGLAAVEAAYRSLVTTVGAHNIVFAGDSAGGGLILAFAHRLRANGETMPAALLLLFPWLDATMTEPTQPGIENRDPVLEIEKLRVAGQMWAGDTDPSDPRVSPLLLRDQTGLPPTLVLVGTRDLLAPDARCFAEAKPDTVLREYPGMFHGFICAPIPEAREAFEEIARFVDRHVRRAAVATFGAQPWSVPNGVTGYHWSVQQPRATVLLQHGYGEYAGRYVEYYSQLVPELQKRGLEVFAFDLEGHGLSSGARGVTDIGGMIDAHIAARKSLASTGRPLFLVGHSLGGLVTAVSAAEHPGAVSGVILTSPALPQSGYLVRKLAGSIAKIAPGKSVTRLGDPSSLSRQKEIVKAYLADQYIFRRRLPAKLAATALAAAERLWPRLGSWSVPTLVLHGLADTSTDPKTSRRFVGDIVSDDKALVVFENGRHELLNDLDAQSALNSILIFIERRISNNKCEYEL